MNLIRWNDPFTGLSSMHSQLDDMFNNFFNAVPGSPTMPAMDVYTEDDKSLVAEVQAPGFDKDDIEVNVHNGVLEIKGERREKQEDSKDKKRSYMVRESHASFYRSIALPKYADGDNVQAEFDKGVLKVTVPFKELPAPKRVAIGDGGGKSGKK
ncbi:MAG TPA: Hsp20/alpha crystallin family protein [Candidatus Saccharimonadales bacterium]